MPKQSVPKQSVPKHATTPRGPLPVKAGIGLRAVHHDELLADRAPVGWLEAHAENYFADGGAQLEIIDRIADRYPLSLHGVGLSLGSADALDREHLRRLKRLVDRVQPALVSEHVCWGAIGGAHLNDLLPLPYTGESLRHLAARVGELQDVLGRQVLLENVSSYLTFSCSELDEGEFLSALARESGCGLLLDVNNVYVSARNHGFDARDFIARLPADAIQEIHLAGHSVNRFEDREILIDTHSTHVCEEVWSLYDYTVERIGPTPTLIEWDTEIPALHVLVAEAHRADLHLRGARDLAA
jgi:uncharacterized protein (UPF0276 family)